MIAWKITHLLELESWQLFLQRSKTLNSTASGDNFLSLSVKTSHKAFTKTRRRSNN